MPHEGFLLRISLLIQFFSFLSLALDVLLELVKELAGDVGRRQSLLQELSIISFARLNAVDPFTLQKLVDYFLFFLHVLGAECLEYDLIDLVLGCS